KKTKPFSNASSISKRSTLKQSVWILSALLLVSNTTPAMPHPISNTLHSVESLTFKNQDRVIKGTVRDANSNTPLAGATIRVIGKSAVTSTNESGAFEISASVNDFLDLSSIGYLK